MSERVSYALTVLLTAVIIFSIFISTAHGEIVESKQYDSLKQMRVFKNVLLGPTIDYSGASHRYPKRLYGLSITYKHNLKY